MWEEKGGVGAGEKSVGFLSIECGERGLEHFCFFFLKRHSTNFALIITTLTIVIIIFPPPHPFE